MDAYKEFHIFYTPDNRMEAIEIFPENRNGLGRSRTSNL